MVSTDTEECGTIIITKLSNPPDLYIKINLRRSRDCLCGSVAADGRLRLFVCVIALLHLLILGKCYALHINASSL